MLPSTDHRSPLLTKMEELSALAKMLRGVHHILHCNGEVGLALIQQNECLMEFLSITRCLAKKHSLDLMRLFPSQFAALQKNELMIRCSSKAIDDALVEEVRRSSMLGSTSEGSSELDAVPLAYSDRRDSRNTGAHQLLHANQQKLRDRVHDWIRQRASMGESVALRLAHEILWMIHPENFSWLSEVLLNEFEQLERQKASHRIVGEGWGSAMGRSKLERLEERLTKVSLNVSGAVDESNAIISFVSLVDSARLTQALQSVLFERIEALMRPIVDGTNRMEPRFSSDVQRLAGLGRLLAAVSARIVGRYEDPVLCFCREALQDAEADGSLLVTLPWLLAWLRECPLHVPVMQGLLLALHRRLATSCRTQDPHHANRIALLVLLSAFKPLYSSPLESEATVEGEGEAEGGGGGGGRSTGETLYSAGSVFGKRLDEDDSLLGLERILSHCVPEYRQLIVDFSLVSSPLGGSPSLAMTNVSLAPSILPTSGSHVRPHRKVRPINESGLGAAIPPSQSQVQKRLRQWFWWQHPVLKELLMDTLPRYLAAGETSSLEEVATRLWTCVPRLLPPALRGGHGKMEELVIALILEGFQSITLNTTVNHHD